MRVVYKSFNGKEFETKEECATYEKSILFDSINTIQSWCKQFVSCGECPFWMGMNIDKECMFCHNTPIEWDVDEIFN